MTDGGLVHHRRWPRPSPTVASSITDGGVMDDGRCGRHGRRLLSWITEAGVIHHRASRRIAPVVSVAFQLSRRPCARGGSTAECSAGCRRSPLARARYVACCAPLHDRLRSSRPRRPPRVPRRPRRAARLLGQRRGDHAPELAGRHEHRRRGARRVAGPGELRHGKRLDLRRGRLDFRNQLRQLRWIERIERLRRIELGELRRIRARAGAATPAPGHRAGRLGRTAGASGRPRPRRPFTSTG